MPDYIGIVVQHWVEYIFGSVLIGGIVLLFFLALWGLKRNWSLDMYIIVFVPIIAVMTLSSVGNVFGDMLFTGIVIILGLIIGIGFIKIVR